VEQYSDGMCNCCRLPVWTRDEGFWVRYPRSRLRGDYLGWEKIVFGVGYKRECVSECVSLRRCRCMCICYSIVGISEICS